MTRTTETLRIRDIADIPSIEAVRTIPREKMLKLVFEGTINAQREAVGQALKNDLDGFWVGVHMIEPEINVAKLITEQEVERHQDFFEACARDYRNLATGLIFALAQRLNVDIGENVPLLTFHNCEQKGSMG